MAGDPVLATFAGTDKVQVLVDDANSFARAHRAMGKIPDGIGLIDELNLTGSEKHTMESNTEYENFEAMRIQKKETFAAQIRDAIERIENLPSAAKIQAATQYDVLQVLQFLESSLSFSCKHWK